MKAAKGRNVVVHYRGTLEDGEAFDSSEGRDPLEFVVGGGDFLPGFEKPVLRMEPGQGRTVTLEPEEAYGPYKAEFAIEGSCGSLRESEPKVGQSSTVRLRKG